MQDGGHFSLKMSENKENSIASSLFCLEFMFSVPLNSIEYKQSLFPIFNQVKKIKTYTFLLVQQGVVPESAEYNSFQIFKTFEVGKIFGIRLFFFVFLLVISCTSTSWVFNKSQEKHLTAQSSIITNDFNTLHDYFFPILYRLN